MTDLGLTPHILIRPKKPAFWGGFSYLGEKRWGWAWWSGGELLHL